CLAAFRLPASAPFVGENDLGTIVAEGGGMPVGEVRVRDGVDAPGVHRIRNVEQQAVAFAGPSCESDLRVERDVMALRRAGTGAVDVGAVFGLPGRKGLTKREAVAGRGLASASAAHDDIREKALNSIVGEDVG